MCNGRTLLSKLKESVQVTQKTGLHLDLPSFICNIIIQRSCCCKRVVHVDENREQIPCLAMVLKLATEPSYVGRPPDWISQCHKTCKTSRFIKLLNILLYCTNLVLHECTGVTIYRDIILLCRFSFIFKKMID